MQHAAVQRRQVHQRQVAADEDDVVSLASDLEHDHATLSASDSSILLFAPAFLPPQAGQDKATRDRRQSDSSSWSSSYASSNSSRNAPASPATVAHSLFPSHGGDGWFSSPNEQDSLVNSGLAPSIYASAQLPLPDDTSSIPSSSSDGYEQVSRPSRRRGRGPPSAASTSFSNVSRPSFSESELGSSWALTEEALATLPEGRMSYGARSAVFTSDEESSSFSEEETFSVVRPAGSTRVARAGRRSRRTASRRRSSVHHHVVDSDGESFVGTPSAVSAGILAPRRSREAYPSPPPESHASLGAKRRHRRAGGSRGSQKRSSTSGSAIASAEGIRLAAPRSPALKANKPLARPPKAVEKELFLGRVMSKLFDVDLDFLETPSSGAAAVAPRISQSAPTSPKHGFEALVDHARRESGDAMFEIYAVEEEELSGDETETEDRSTSEPKKQWVRAYPADVVGSGTESTSKVGRSVSLTDLPRALFQALTPLSTSTSTPRSSSRNRQLSSPVNGRLASLSPLRRTASAQVEGGSEYDFFPDGPDGLEAALGYWRRWLRRWTGINEEDDAMAV